jgi:high-affinity K+ transport system ATPase subunit B
MAWEVAKGTWTRVIAKHMERNAGAERVGRSEDNMLRLAEGCRRQKGPNECSFRDSTPFLA